MFTVLERQNTTKKSHLKYDKTQAQTKLKTHIFGHLTQQQGLLQTFQTAKVYDIIFKVIPYSYHPFGRKLLPNILPTVFEQFVLVHAHELRCLLLT